MLSHNYFQFYKQRQAYLIVHVCNTSLWEAERGVQLKVQGWPGLCRETLFGKNKTELKQYNKTT